MAGLLSDILGAVDRAKQSASANLGLLFSDPREYIATLNDQAREFNRLQSLAAQGDLNARRGLPVTQEQVAARQYVDQVTKDLAMGFAGTVNLPKVSQARLTSERSYYGYPDKTSKGILVYMNPEKFLELAKKGGDVEARALKMKKFSEEKLNEEFLPYLEMGTKNNYPAVIAHEGRARAQRALMDKIEQIPVVISTRGERFKSIRDVPTLLQPEDSTILTTIKKSDYTPVELLLKK